MLVHSCTWSVQNSNFWTLEKTTTERHSCIMPQPDFVYFESSIFMIASSIVNRSEAVPNANNCSATHTLVSACSFTFVSHACNSLHWAYLLVYHLRVLIISSARHYAKRHELSPNTETADRAIRLVTRTVENVNSLRVHMSCTSQASIEALFHD